MEFKRFIDHFGLEKEPHTPCVKELDISQPSFNCCECFGASTAYCLDCFFNSSHQNHLYRILIDTGGVCDCGDSSAVLQQDSCANHQNCSREFIIRDSRETFFESLGICKALLRRCKKMKDLDAVQDCIKGLRYLTLFSLFHESQYGQVYQNVNDVNELMNLAEKTVGMQPLPIAYQEFIKDRHPLLTLLTKDFYFRVLGIQLIRYSFSNQVNNEEALSLSSSQIVTEPYTMQFIARYRFLERVLCKEPEDRSILEHDLTAFYRFSIVAHPQLAKYLLQSDYLLLLYQYQTKVSSVFTIDTGHVCDNYLDFFDQFDNRLIMCTIYFQMFEAVNLSWLSVGEQIQKYINYSIKRDNAEEIKMSSRTYQQSVQYKQLLLLISSSMNMDTPLQNQFQVLPNVIIHKMMLNMLKCDVTKGELVGSLSRDLGLSMDDLIYKLSNSLLYSVIPLFKILSGYFKQYMFELEIICKHCLQGQWFMHYLICFQFLQEFLPLTTFKFNILSSWIEMSDMELYLKLLNSICFSPSDQDYIKCQISNDSLMHNNLNIDYFFEIYSNRRELSTIITELFTFQSRLDKSQSYALRLQTTDFVEPAIMIYDQDQLFSNYQLQYNTDKLFTRLTKPGSSSIATLFTNDDLDDLSRIYCNNELSISNRAIILRILHNCGYRSDLSFRSADKRLFPFESMVFQQPQEKEACKINKFGRLKQLKERIQASKELVISESSALELQRQPELPICNYCHSVIESDLVQLILCISKCGKTVTIACPHLYHLGCIEHIGTQCPVCKHQFNYLLANGQLIWQEGNTGDSDEITVQQLYECNCEYIELINAILDVTDEQRAKITDKINYCQEVFSATLGCKNNGQVGAAACRPGDQYYLIDPGQFPSNLTTLLASSQQCQLCGKPYKLPCYQLNTRAPRCEDCVSKDENYWSLQEWGIWFYNESMILPYRDRFGQIRDSVEGFQQNFDPELLNYQVFNYLFITVEDEAEEEINEELQRQIQRLLLSGS